MAVIGERGKRAVILALAVLLALVVWLGTKACNLYDAVSEAHGKNAALRAELEKANAEREKERAASAKIIVELDRKINLMKRDAETSMTEAAAWKKKADELAAVAVEAATCEERVWNLEGQVRSLRLGFKALEEAVGKKDKEIAAWTMKYDEAVRVGESWKAQAEAERRLRLNVERERRDLAFRLRMERFWSGVLKIAVVAEGIYIGYSELRAASRK